MAADIGQELYEKIKAEFEGRVSANGYIKAVTKRIAEGTATMNDVSLYAKALGSEVRLAIAYNISPEVLPEGQMFYNIAQKILDPLLHDNHSMVNNIAAEVQKKLDERKGIRIKPQKAEFPEDRLGSVLSAASEQGLDEATMKRRMSAPAETMTQSFADDYMKENAKFRTRAGFKEYIVRKEDGKCCEWCSKLAGRYLYPESTPHDVFRRHDNCGCSVTYEDGEMRTRQQVWSKRDWSDEEEQKYLEASDKHKRTMAAMKEDLRLYKEGKLSAKDAYISFQENRKALANIRNLRDRTPVKFTPAQAEALENLVLANSARAKNPVDISAESGIMGERNVSSRNLPNGLRTAPSHILTEEEINSLKEDISAIEADENVFKFNVGSRTGYDDILDEIHIKGDILPDPNSTHPRDRMSARAALAHEYYGHRTYRGTDVPKGAWNDEFRASYMAAKNCPNLNDDERRELVLDALERAKESGITIKHNEFIRRTIYGY